MALGTSAAACSVKPRLDFLALHWSSYKWPCFPEPKECCWLGLVLRLHMETPTSKSSFIFRLAHNVSSRCDKNSALSLVGGIVPPGMPPAGAVRWLRPSEVSGGDGAVLFLGDVPGSSPMVAGQVRHEAPTPGLHIFLLCVWSSPPVGLGLCSQSAFIAFVPYIP